MIDHIFFARKYRRVYAIEILNLCQKHGDEAHAVVKARAGDRHLSDRDRLHWKRVLIAMTPSIFNKPTSYVAQKV
jgi:hypothetical protein